MGMRKCRRPSDFGVSEHEEKKTSCGNFNRENDDLPLDGMVYTILGQTP